MNKTLSSLILDFNRFGTPGVEALCKGLSTNSTLKKLSLKHCDIDEEGGSPIAKMLLFKRLALQHLDLTCNQLGGAGLTSICTGLIDNTSLKSFRLAENSINHGKEDVKALELLSEVLKTHPSLMAVDLLHNKIGNAGALILLPAVKENNRVTEFKIDSANMDDEVYNALFRAGVPAQKGGKKKASSKKKTK